MMTGRRTGTTTSAALSPLPPPLPRSLPRSIRWRVQLGILEGHHDEERFVDLNSQTLKDQRDRVEQLLKQYGVAFQHAEQELTVCADPSSATVSSLKRKGNKTLNKRTNARRNGTKPLVLQRKSVLMPVPKSDGRNRGTLDSKSNDGDNNNNNNNNNNSSDDGINVKTDAVDGCNRSAADSISEMNDDSTFSSDDESLDPLTQAMRHNERMEEEARMEARKREQMYAKMRRGHNTDDEDDDDEDDDDDDDVDEDDGYGSGIGLHDRSLDGDKKQNAIGAFPGKKRHIKVCSSGFVVVVAFALKCAMFNGSSFGSMRKDGKAHQFSKPPSHETAPVYSFVLLTLSTLYLTQTPIVLLVCFSLSLPPFLSHSPN